MNKQVCTKCKIEKELTEFNKGNNKIGLHYRCKSCLKQYQEINKNKLKNYRKEYQQQNKETLKSKKKDYYNRNKEVIALSQKKYYKNNITKIKKYRKDNRDILLKNNKIYYENNKEKTREYIEKRKEYRNFYRKEKRKTDPLFKLKANIRTRLYHILKGSKSKKTEKLLGTSYKEVKLHLEKSFTEGMTWENYGEWHVDHIIPLSSGKTVKEIEKLCHYSNLQALWAFDNLTKSNKCEVC